MGQTVPNEQRIVRVDAASRAYDVVIGDAARLDPRLSERIRAAVPRARTALLVTDAGIPAGSVVAHVMQALGAAGLAVVHDGSLRIAPHESMKVLATAERLAAAMTEAKLDRADVAVVLGGGVLGDLVGFAAATYRRGIAWINMPTTLLAMVDASVGGKTGTNIAVGPERDLKKNMVGAFWQPSLVVADVDVLRSLPERQFRCGLAECLKHGMLSAAFGDPGLWAWTLDNLDRVASHEPAALVELVARNVSVKARVVAGDEREESPDTDTGAGGGRALLNLGHTFAHAIETLAPSGGASAPDQAVAGDLQHGEAVGLGLIAASAATESLGGGASGAAVVGLTERTRAAVQRAGLPTRVAGLPSDADLIRRMADDKKVVQGALRLVLPVGDGTCRVTRHVATQSVAAGWQSIRA